MQTQTAVFGVEFTRRSSQPILIKKKKMVILIFSMYGNNVRIPMLQKVFVVQEDLSIQELASSLDILFLDNIILINCLIFSFLFSTLLYIVFRQP